MMKQSDIDRLLDWYAAGHRDLPWRKDREPYHVWISEIMLQQTRVEAVRGYYTRFLDALPRVEDLASAPEELCRKLWEGLGYYSRIRNAQRAARQIVQTGHFPETFEELRALPGVGDYTAGAIASICFEQPTPAVDGNVLRVWARVEADERPMNDAKVKKEVARALQPLYRPGRCGDTTQALMELGATVCVPSGAPRCESCPLRGSCRALRDGRTAELPVKQEKKTRRVEEMTVFLLRCEDRIALRKRPETGLLAELWELPNVPGRLSLDEALRRAEAWELHPDAPERIVEEKHIFTHVEWKMRAVSIACKSAADAFVWVTAKELEQGFALPTAFRKLLGQGKTSSESAGRSLS
ncbi:MAG: A/G-specific adenine glycosylase [Oscillospiraceae bacterium]|nr:A/G-specific adenine glycosylase [Oscillospiraceae bacterium]MBR3849815.1 A/G-specific adenine glycosylase [Oscillospiraceae bacterium]